jgi:hypothetical protein
LASVEFLNEIKVQYERKPVKIGKGTIKRSEDVIPILKEIYDLGRIGFSLVCEGDYGLGVDFLGMDSGLCSLVLEWNLSLVFWAGGQWCH